MNFVNWNELLKRVPAFAFLAVAAWLLGRIALSAWGWARIEPPAPAAVEAAASAGNSEARVPGSALFGEPRQGGAAADAPAVLSSGEFRLRGVVASSRQGMAHAIIESRGASAAYFPGDIVAPGITLQEVRPDEARLRRGAEILRLPLSNLSPGAMRGPARGAASFSRNDQPAIARNAPARMPLLQILRMNPIMEKDGSLRGYRLLPRGQQGMFDSLGLVPGDLLVAINGLPYNNDNMEELARQINAGEDMMLTVERAGQKYEIVAASQLFSPLAM